METIGHTLRLLFFLLRISFLSFCSFLFVFFFSPSFFLILSLLFHFSLSTFHLVHLIHILLLFYLFPLSLPFCFPLSFLSLFTNFPLYS